jgi:hypothetical protein
MPSRLLIASLLIVGGALVGTMTTGALVGREANVPAVQPGAPATPPVAQLAPVPDPDATTEPGKVHWHATFDAARDAAKKSGKPVLLFQMMGRLDHTFC